MTFEAISFAVIPSLMVMYFGHTKQLSPKNIAHAIIIANLIGFVFNTTQLAIWAGGFGPVVPFIPIRLMFSVTNSIIGVAIMEVLYKRLNENELIEQM
jgi:hypothetical protein